jgi:hypothetical protein
MDSEERHGQVTDLITKFAWALAVSVYRMELQTAACGC